MNISNLKDKEILEPLRAHKFSHGSLLALQNLVGNKKKIEPICDYIAKITNKEQQLK